MTMMQHPSSTTPLDFTVSIVACGPLCHNNMVYAIGVVQPVQSWTVLRSHDDFVALSQSLCDRHDACPSVTQLVAGLHNGGNTLGGSNHNNNSIIMTPEHITHIRNTVQEWLTNILLHDPLSRSLSSMRDFLTLGANIILPMYEGVVWTQFPNMAPQGSSHYHVSNSTTCINASPSNNNKNTSACASVDDMEMDIMFSSNNGDDDAARHGDIDDDLQEDYVLCSSERYKPTAEAVTDEDELDMMQGDIEMVEDIGSLAQSMGASHLGRSLQLQAEMTNRNNSNNVVTNNRLPPPAPPRQGLNIRGSPLLDSSSKQVAAGGLGGAMAQAASNGAFTRSTMESAASLDSFKMIRVIGKGSFGKVFLVREHKTNTIYALKVLRKDNIIKRNQVEHTKTERSVLGYVQHPFIVGMNMAFQSKDKLYFVLDYCAGGELFFHLGKEGKFQEARTRFYAAEIILAISYVHSLDIIYRDLKPENVLLDSQGHIRLTDFGLSKEGISNSSSGANSFCGTPEYLAPEILNRQGHGRAVDWWSLGALLYEMLTGLPPFYCQDRERLFEKIRKSELTYPLALSRPSVNLLKGLLTKDPTIRLGSGPTDADEIKPHEFFAPINWDKLMKGDITPPWVPNIQGSTDTSLFDKEFTQMPVFSPHSMQRVHGFGATPKENHFEGFTFTDRILHGQAGAH
ncbi:hypothetical protein MPSEU_000383600 [Mayamaea pseudoterrestris]|nr:hypothetical protein MPSEU_000383600 [Mayamaea pseudoterrestris]